MSVTEPVVRYIVLWVEVHAVLQLGLGLACLIWLTSLSDKHVFFIDIYLSFYWQFTTSSSSSAAAAAASFLLSLLHQHYHSSILRSEKSPSFMFLFWINVGVVCLFLCLFRDLSVSFPVGLQFVCLFVYLWVLSLFLLPPPPPLPLPLTKLLLDLLNHFNG